MTYQKKLLQYQWEWNLYEHTEITVGGDFLNHSKPTKSHACLWCTTPGAQGPYDCMKIGRYQTVTVGKECVHGLQGKARVVRKFIGGVLSFCIISRETVTSCGYMGQALWYNLKQSTTPFIPLSFSF